MFHRHTEPLLLPETRQPPKIYREQKAYIHSKQVFKISSNVQALLDLLAFIYRVQFFIAIPVKTLLCERVL